MPKSTAGFVKTMCGMNLRFTQIQCDGYLVPRWYVTVGYGSRAKMADFAIFLDDKMEKGIYRVYREITDSRREFIGFAPTLSFARRLCATETKRLFEVNEKASRKRLQRQHTVPEYA